MKFTSKLFNTANRYHLYVSYACPCKANLFYLSMVYFIYNFCQQKCRKGRGKGEPMVPPKKIDF